MTYYRRVECPYRGCPDCEYEGCKWCFEFEKVTEPLLSRAEWEATIDYGFIEELYSAAMAHIDEYGTVTEYNEWPKRWDQLVAALGVGEETP